MRTRTMEVYLALYKLTNRKGKPPVIREIVSEMGLTKDGLSVVFYALQALVELGLVEKHRPIRKGLYVPILPPDEVDWEALKGDGDEREDMESE